MKAVLFRTKRRVERAPAAHEAGRRDLTPGGERAASSGTTHRSCLRSRRDGDPQHVSPDRVPSTEEVTDTCLLALATAHRGTLRRSPVDG